MKKLPEVLETPQSKPTKLAGAKWLAGEGAGSWFLIESQDNSHTLFLVRRFSDQGCFECGGYFKATSILDLAAGFELTYPSHCMKVSVIQNKTIITLNLTKKKSF